MRGRASAAASSAALSAPAAAVIDVAQLAGDLDRDRRLVIDEQRQVGGRPCRVGDHRGRALRRGQCRQASSARCSIIGATGRISVALRRGSPKASPFRYRWRARGSCTALLKPSDSMSAQPRDPLWCACASALSRVAGVFECRRTGATGAGRSAARPVSSLHGRSRSGRLSESIEASARRRHGRGWRRDRRHSSSTSTS